MEPEYNMFKDYFRFDRRIHQGANNHNYQDLKPEICRPLRGRRHNLADYFPEQQLSNELTGNKRLGSNSMDLSDWFDADSPSEREMSKDHCSMSPDCCITGCFMRDSKLEYSTGIFQFECDSLDADFEYMCRSSTDDPCSSNSQSDKEDNNGSPIPHKWYNGGDSDRNTAVNDSITHGSTCFYRDNESDYDCLEEVSPMFAPANAFNFNGTEMVPIGTANQGINGLNERAAFQNVLEENVQEIALTMLQRLSLNPGSCDMENNILPRNTRSLDVMKHCAFCKRNGETREFYTTHIVKDSRGKVVCPILRKYVCPICKATGDSAHTVRHCPFKLKTALHSSS